MTTTSEIFEQYREMSDVLRADVDACYDALVNDHSQTARRQFCRAFFAQVEGVMYGYKQIALMASDSALVDFSHAEQSLLREESYELADNGEATHRPARLPFKANFRFSMKALAKAFKSDVVLPIPHIGWDKFCKSVKVRDRLMHPKTPASLTVTDDELRDLKEAQRWFLECRSAVLGLSRQEHLAKLGLALQKNENAPTPLSE